MARGRMISKSWSTSKKRAVLYREAGPLAEFCLQLFPLLIAHSDDYGRLDGDPETVKLVCDPGAPRPVSDFVTALGQLEIVGLVRRYDVAGSAWLQIVKFDEHQPGLLSKRTIAKSPEPPTDTEVAGNSGLTKPNLTQPNKTQEKKNMCPEPLPRSGPVPVVQSFLEFPVAGQGPTTWALSEAQIEDWISAFPGLNLRLEARRALAWVQANPGRRKTARGMGKFLLGWFGRANDRGGDRPAIRQAAPAAFRDWDCPHETKCHDGAFRCNQRTQLEAAKAGVG